MTTENPYETPGVDGRGPTRWKRRLAWLATAGLGGLILVALLLPMRRPGVHKAARRAACAGNLRFIALALQSYARQHGTLPPACTRDADGRPLHSWRTLILPYLEERALFESIDLSKPWDDPANAAARARMPAVYRCPAAELPPEQTTYLAVVSLEGCFRPDRVVGLDEVARPAATLLVAEFPATLALHWMAPEDAGEKAFTALGPDTPSPHPPGIMNGAFADGHVAPLSLTETPECGPEWRRALLRTDDQKVDPVE